MSPRLTSLCLSSSLLAAAALAGCSEPQARFADASREQLERVYSASSGSDLFEYFSIGMFFSGRNDSSSCASVVTRGQDTTVTFHCTTEEGADLEGTIAIHNVRGEHDNPAYDPSQPSSIEFDLHGTTPEHEHDGIDGYIELYQSRISGDLTIEDKGITSTSRLALACDVDGACTASPDSEIEISALGNASVEGTWNIGQPPSGHLTLRGADVLTFDVSGRDEDGCMPYAIGDKSGTVCVPYLDF